MQVRLAKIQANGAGYLAVDAEENPGLNIDRMSDFARAACDLAGTVGAEGIVAIRSSGAGSVVCMPYSADGRVNTFSVNALIAAAAYQHYRNGDTAVTIKLRDHSYPVNVRTRGDGLLDCDVSEIQVGQPRTYSAEDVLQRLQTINGFTPNRSVTLDVGGQLQCAVFVDSISDGDLLVLGEGLNRDPLANITLSMVRQVNASGGFLRSYSPYGNGLVTSCSAAYIAAATALSEDDGGSRTLYGIAGAARVRVQAKDPAEAASLASVSARAALIYRGKVGWDRARLGDRLDGEVYMSAFEAISRCEKSELDPLAHTQFYAPIPKER